jgi:hypothetical protein
MALLKNTPITVLEGKLQAYPLYQAIHAYEGSLIFKRSDGYVTNVAGGNVFLGHAYAEANNANGGDGALEVFVRTGNYFAKAAVASLAITDLGSPVYASDDGTLVLTASGNSRVGRVAKFISTGIGIVEFCPITKVDGTPGAHIADAKVNYTTGDLDAEAEIIAAFNTTNGKINTLLAELEAFGVLLTS